MPFRADYLTPDEVDKEYREVLRRLECEQLRNLIQRLANPGAVDDLVHQYDRMTRALQTIEDDWDSTKRLRDTPLSPEVIDGCDRK